MSTDSEIVQTTNTINLKVVTPYGMFLEKKCEMVVLPTSDGEQGVMFGHAPFIAAIYPGKLKVFSEGKQRNAFISAGYAEVRRFEIVIISNAAEWAEDIDIERAKQAVARAEERLKDNNLPDYLIRRNKHAIRRAKARLKIAEN